ncbi:hypothetical protein Ancab_035095 [Ancistrocladus abbreviatus]
MGNARHENLKRLLEYCHNEHLAYLLYDYLPNRNLAEKIEVKRGEFPFVIKEELYADIYNFGKVIIEILANGKMRNSGKSTQLKPKELVIEEICSENEVAALSSLQREIRKVLEVAFFCTRSSKNGKVADQGRG